MILNIKNLTKTYGKRESKVVALDDVSFQVEQGEFIAIVGQSGSGKSTLLHLIAGIDSPDSGKVFLEDADIFSLSKNEIARFRRQKIGIIYQFYNLVPVLNVLENIALPVRLDNKPVDSNRLTDIVSLLNLNGREKHLPNQLSGGQQQRTAIGRVLFQNTSIILADEPTGNLDSKNGEEVISYLERINKEFNKTILLITHDSKVAARATRTITLADGKIVSDIKN